MSISKPVAVLLYPLIFIGIAAASFLPAEGVFRLLGDKPSGDMRGLYESFGPGGYKLGANVDTSADWASGKFSVHTDGLGLRCDRDRTFAVNPGDQLDVLFVGDSQGVGNGVNFESTIAGSAALCARERQLRVANMSVGGHTMTQQLELLRELTEEKHIKARMYVLLTTPVMTLGCDGYSHATVGTDGRLYDAPKTPREMALIYLKSHAVTYSRVRNAIRNAGIGVNPTRDTPFLFHVYGEGIEESRASQNFTECVGRFAAFASEHGARLMLVYVPLTVEADFQNVDQAATSRGLKLDRDLPGRICASVSKNLNLPFHDLRPTVQKLRLDGDTLHLTGDYHYDSTLSSACGRSICGALQSFLLPRQANTNPSSPSSWN